MNKSLNKESPPWYFKVKMCQEDSKKGEGLINEFENKSVSAFFEGLLLCTFKKWNIAILNIRQDERTLDRPINRKHKKCYMWKDKLKENLRRTCQQDSTLCIIYFSFICFTVWLKSQLNHLAKPHCRCFWNKEKSVWNGLYMWTSLYWQNDDDLGAGAPTENQRGGSWM